LFDVEFDFESGDDDETGYGEENEGEESGEDYAEY